MFQLVRPPYVDTACCQLTFGMLSCGCQVVDAAVLKFRGAVTHFSPGSYASRPTQRTSFPNLFMAGDWVKGLDHGANGLSQVCDPGGIRIVSELHFSFCCPFSFLFLRAPAAAACGCCHPARSQVPGA